MITLITGVPGSGKTALLVSMLMAEKERRVYVDGVRDLTVPHEVAPPLEEWASVSVKDSIGGMFFTFPQGSLIVCDEAQRHFRPRSVGSRVPESVQAFETHRHLGLDFWLVTQHPNLIDSNVRKLVGRHIHIRVTWAGRSLLEWSDCQDVESSTARSLAARKPFRLPKKTFALYKSAELHTKQPRRIPIAVYVLVLAVGGTAWMGLHLYGSLSDRFGVKQAAVPGLGAKVGVQSGVAPSAPGPAVLSPAVWYEQRVPRVEGLEYTAPVYDEVTKPVDAPRPAACIATAQRCRCWSQQATPLQVPESICRQVVAGGLFVPWQVADGSSKSRGPSHSDGRPDVPE